MATISAIEGIGPRHADKLRGCGIRTCESLLKRGATKKGRAALAKESGLNDQRILEWVNRADLMRVKGVSTQYSDLLEAAGVDTVRELKRRNAANLAEAMTAANNRKRNKLVQRTPSVKIVQKWVDHAKSLPAAVTY